MKALGLILILAIPTTHAAVVRVEITNRTPIETDAKTKSPRYELLSGTFYGELDLASPHNSIITDLALAPRNARGKVEYSATFALAKPVNMRESSGVLFYDV